MSQHPHQVTELTGTEYAELLGPDWYADDDESVTICDRCGEEIPLAMVGVKDAIFDEIYED